MKFKVGDYVMLQPDGDSELINDLPWLNTVSHGVVAEVLDERREYPYVIDWTNDKGEVPDDSRSVAFSADELQFHTMKIMTEAANEVQSRRPRRARARGAR